MDTTIIEQFARVLAGPEAVITDPQVLTTAGHDFWGFGGTPGLLLRPRSRDEVVAVMQLATTHQIPVVPRGGASNCSAGGKLAESSDKSERGELVCPNIHPNFSWVKVRTRFPQSDLLEKSRILFKRKVQDKFSSEVLAQSASRAL